MPPWASIPCAQSPRGLLRAVTCHRSARGGGYYANGSILACLAGCRSHRATSYMQFFFVRKRMWRPNRFLILGRMFHSNSSIPDGDPHRVQRRVRDGLLLHPGSGPNGILFVPRFWLRKRFRSFPTREDRRVDYYFVGKPESNPSGGTGEQWGETMIKSHSDLFLKKKKEMCVDISFRSLDTCASELNQRSVSSRISIFIPIPTLSLPSSPAA